MPASLTLGDFSDFDLLGALDEAGDDDGWATSQEVARQIGIEHPNPAKCVGARFAWLNRFGLMEQDTLKDGTMKWRLNPTGTALIYPSKSMPVAIQRALETLSESQMIWLTDSVAQGLPGTSRQAAHLARRAWRNRFGDWRDPLLFATKGEGRSK
jgi:hypothetical protein